MTGPATCGDAPDTHRRAVTDLCATAFGSTGPEVTGLSDVNRGRGAFSVVLRAELSWPAGTVPSADHPPTVVAKLPIAGPNGAAAIAGGAYRREALAYRDLLPGGPIAAPRLYAVDEPGDGTCALLLEDLSDHRWFDQLDGLPSETATAVAAELARFHRFWAQDARLGTLAVRHNTVAGLPAEGLAAGLESLETTWAEDLTDAERARYRRLVDGRAPLAQMFERAGKTLCHGDPRADNLVFDHNWRLVLFDWQQMAVQFGEADLAWLSATSLDVEVRRRIDGELVAAYGGTVDRYRLGLALPGLTVLLLAQRRLADDRTKRFVVASLKRIAAAIEDLDVAGLVR